MAHKEFLVALSLIVAAAPVSATQTDAEVQPLPANPAPPGGPDTRYCMHIEAVTGSRIENVVCWTRAEWADQGVDVDQDWAKEGVRVIG
jgi:hypothetical protein